MFIRTLLSLVVCLCSIPFLAQGQFNTRLVSQVEYESAGNDIWGYVAPDGTEYALMGLRSGISIVSLANPEEPEEAVFVPGQFSIWRDIKTYGEYAYITTDQSRTTEGMTVIDLTGLPERAEVIQNYRPIFGQDTLNRCHNLYIDTTEGFAYLAGCDVNAGGMVIVDVGTDPTSPSFRAFGPAIYAHDVFVQDQRMYASELFSGELAIYDVSDKDDIILLGTALTPFQFTHNAWASEDGRYVYTTDERSNASVAAYDITELPDIRLVDEYRPLPTINTGVIPHNVHVMDDYLIISHYTDGLVLVDASEPDNLIEIGQYDTFSPTPDQTGFFGAWGAFPFLPSGLILVSDIESGLFVIEPQYRRAARLEGLVRDSLTGQPLNQAAVTITAQQINGDTTGVDGRYRTGLADGGTYEVTYTAPGYLPLTRMVDLVNGQTIEVSVALLPDLDFRVLTGKVRNRADDSGVADAAVFIRARSPNNPVASRTASTETNGDYRLELLPAGNYDLFAGIWGFRDTSIRGIILDSDTVQTIELARGYRDGFIVDQGWIQEPGSESDAEWIRTDPSELPSNDGLPAGPPADVPDDIGNLAYLTSRQGNATLLSPPIDLQNIPGAELSYQLFLNQSDETGGANRPTLEVYLTDGLDTLLLEQLSVSDTTWRAPSRFLIDTLPLDRQFPLTFLVDLKNGQSPFSVRAGIDNFSITADLTTSVFDQQATGLQVNVAPNPSADAFQLQFQFDNLPKSATAEVFTADGRRIEQHLINSNQLQVGNSWPAGVYFLRVISDGEVIGVVRMVKVGG